MLEGVYFLHSNNIIHRDIKGSNVLLDGDWNVKLADFGVSKIMQKIGSKTNLVSHCGTPYWMAPEIFRGEGYGRKADIWSVGCTVVEMLTGSSPLGHLEPAAAIFQIGSKPTEPKLPESVSQDAKEFIQAALAWKPDDRPWSDKLQKYNFVLNTTERCNLGLKELAAHFSKRTYFNFFFIACPRTKLTRSNSAQKILLTFFYCSGQIGTRERG
ncbi:Mitogen-activated protein kinase kinase kinase 2 [Desmophyllum pertusum]|uniref:Mitogen-activated protein kinase kinase kinase 2 n=1 Tax=Desmophyllum pertusum TaxID=174260 RepID=A0A9W9ZMM7_9CNID|nr:Mitogen-activated protein kinase kinase kinase 2 [Desmophyllum pertusum]